MNTKKKNFGSRKPSVKYFTSMAGIIQPTGNSKYCFGGVDGVAGDGGRGRMDGPAGIDRRDG